MTCGGEVFAFARCFDGPWAPSGFASLPHRVGGFAGDTSARWTKVATMTAPDAVMHRIRSRYDARRSR